MEEEEECCGNLEGKRGRRREKVRNWEERGLGDDGRSLGAQLGGRRRRWERKRPRGRGDASPHPIPSSQLQNLLQRLHSVPKALKARDTWVLRTVHQPHSKCLHLRAQEQHKEMCVLLRIRGTGWDLGLGAGGG